MWNPYCTQVKPWGNVRFNILLLLSKKLTILSSISLVLNVGVSLPFYTIHMRVLEGTKLHYKDLEIFNFGTSTLHSYHIHITQMDNCVPLYKKELSILILISPSIIVSLHDIGIDL